eukprot:322557-Prorocentrum_minimum.AAC.2
MDYCLVSGLSLPCLLPLLLSTHLCRPRQTGANLWILEPAALCSKPCCLPLIPPGWMDCPPDEQTGHEPHMSEYGLDATS